MKKFLFYLLIFLIFFISKNICKSYEYSPEIQNEILEQFEESDAKNLNKNLPDYSLEFFNQANINIKNIFSVKNLRFESLINIILNLLKNKIFLFIKFIIPVIFIIIIYSFVSSFCESEQEILKFIITCLVCISTSFNLLKIIQNIVLCLNIASKFVLCFIPVFSSFAISLGLPLSSAAFNSSILFFNQIIMSIAKDIIIPVSNTMSGLCIISSVSSKIKLNKIFDIFYSVIKYLLIFFGALISFIFSVQKIIGNSIENLAGKEIKFMSNLIPIVGSALSDAAIVVRNSAKILWVNIGSFGTISIIFIFLPNIIDCLVLNISFQICEFLSQIFDFKNLENLFLSFKKIINILLAIEIIFTFIFIFVTSITMKINI